MKRTLICFFASALLINSVVAQESETIVVKAGTKVIDYFPPGERYRYPEFRDGKVIFKDNTFIATKLNYNILLGEMHFIQKRDTLALSNLRSVNYINVEEDTFYYDNGFLEVVAGTDPVIMAVKQYVKMLDVQKSGAYGTKSSTSAITSYSSMYGASGTTNYKLVLNEDILLSRKTEYYIGNKEDGFVLYRKKYLRKLFPEYKAHITDYLKHNKVDFTNRDDLIRLTGYLQQLR
jgi:hypothetical protein